MPNYIIRQQDQGQAEAEAKTSRPRPKFWPRDHFGFEAKILASRPLWLRGLYITAWHMNTPTQTVTRPYHMMSMTFIWYGIEKMIVTRFIIIMSCAIFRYSTLEDRDLLRLPISQLCAADGLVVVWVTNKLRQQNFVRDCLFPHWNVTFMAEWYWLKVAYSLPCIRVALIIVKIAIEI